MSCTENMFSKVRVLPVVVIKDVNETVPTLKELREGGVPAAEITFRTACAPEAIKAVAENCPEVLVGAGTIVNLEQCKLAVEMGAKFIVSPGFSDEIVGYCVANGIPVAPGCVTPTEIMGALKHGLKMVKFFPANVYGGLNAMKNLAGPFGTLKFLPTGGVSNANIKEFIDTPFIHAVGGSWVCPKADIAAGNWERSPSCASTPARLLRASKSLFVSPYRGGAQCAHWTEGFTELPTPLSHLR